MDNHESKVTVIASEFVDNYSPSSRGALYSRGGTNLTVEDSQFTNNAATLGGAMYSISSSIMIIACDFANNMASSGRGLYSSASNIIIRETSAFVTTSPDYRVGILFSYGGTITIEALPTETISTVATTEEESVTTITESVVDEPTTAVTVTNEITETTTITAQGLGGALAGLVATLPLTMLLVGILLCKCGKCHCQGKCSKASKLMANESVSTAKICHDDYQDIHTVMTGNVSYSCASAGREAVEGGYESVIADDCDEPMYDDPCDS